MAERKKSWREIDKTRDKTRAKLPPRDKGSIEKAIEDPRLKKLYLSQAEKIFNSSSFDWQTLKINQGMAGFDQMAQSLVEQKGLPSDWPTLLLLLDLKNAPEIVCEAMNKMMQMLSDASLSEKKILKTKLKFLSLTSQAVTVKDEALYALEQL